MKIKNRFVMCLLILAAALFCMACPTEGVADPEDPNTEGPATELDTGKITGDYFTATPVLELESGENPGELNWRFTAATPSDAGTTYLLYLKQVTLPTDTKSDEFVAGILLYTTTATHAESGVWKTRNLEAGKVYTGVVVAKKDEENKAYSNMVAGRVFATITAADPSEDNGLIRSRGRSTTGTTYYIDAARGNDANNGITPDRAWKTFKNANGKTFRPGDHILLEANSVWNGESVTVDNYQALSANYAANDRVAMLAPKGSGEAGKPIVIDLYEIRGETGSEKIYYTADKRPVINGNGTPSVGLNPYFMTGAITVVNGEYWEVNNIEATNSFDFPQILTNPALRDTHWYKNDVIKRLCAIYFAATGNDPKRHIVIKNNYCHDVQSEHSRTPAQDAFGAAHSTLANTRRLKVSGGIAVQELRSTPDGLTVSNLDFAWHDLLIEGNIVKRVSQTGLRNTSQVEGEKIIFRGNYLEAVGGDAFVLTRTKGTGENRSIAEYNIVKDSCSNPNNGNGNFAAAWAIYTLDTTLRYNEVYGTMYGNQDSEAFDFDGGCRRSVYEYNYSHHNAGGAILFMVGQYENVYRFNISANDGIGTIGLYNIYMDGNSPADAMPVSNTQTSYTNFPYGQAIFHYAANLATTPSTVIPLIYNNTFYTGDGYSIGLYGENITTARNYYVRFYNNILIKEGAGTLYLARGHQETNGIAGGTINNPTHFKNNILWGYEPGNPNVGVQAKFSGGSSPISSVISAGGNLFENPNLGIQQAANVALLRAQRDTGFPETEYNDPARLALFTGKERLRNRASMFAPLNANSPAVQIDNGTGPGMVIPVGTNATIDNAWNGGDYAADFRITEDFFGAPVNDSNWPIGAAVAPFTPTAADPYP